MSKGEIQKPKNVGSDGLNKASVDVLVTAIEMANDQKLSDNEFRKLITQIAKTIQKNIKKESK